MRAKVAVTTHVAPANPLESAISTPPPAESSHFSAFLLNGAWSNAARIVYVSAASRPISALFAIKKEVSIAKAAAAQATVTLKHLAATLAGSHEMAKKQSETILGDFVGLVVKHLKKGDRIRIGGLGILQVPKPAARMGRNPPPGHPINIKPSHKHPFPAPSSPHSPS